MSDRLPIHAINATGTPDGTKALHGDGTWKAPAADANLTAHLADTVDAHDASAISVVPAGGIAATDVQAALAELDTEKAATGHTHATTGELLMQDGVTAPPVPLENEARSDWLYQG